MKSNDIFKCVLVACVTLVVCTACIVTKSTEPLWILSVLAFIIFF